MHRLDLGLYFHPKEFWGEWSLNPHVNSRGKIPSTGKCPQRRIEPATLWTASPNTTNELFRPPHRPFDSVQCIPHKRCIKPGQDGMCSTCCASIKRHPRCSVCVYVCTLARACAYVQLVLHHVVNQYNVVADAACDDVDLWAPLICESLRITG